MGARGRRWAPRIAPYVRMLPSGNGQPGMWLYAIGIPGDITKIGITGRPRRRIAQHINAHGPLVWVHLFRPHSTRFARDAERLSLTLAAALGQRIGITENFTSLSRADALSAVREAVSMLEA